MILRQLILSFNTLQVVVTQMNGSNHPTESIHVLHVGKMRVKLCKGKTTIAKEYYSSSMQVVQIESAVWFKYGSCSLLENCFSHSFILKLLYFH